VFLRFGGAPLYNAAEVSLRPDLVENGSTLGVFSLHSKPNPDGSHFLAMTVTCTYDKTTYLLHTCTRVVPDVAMQQVSTYGKWNDPSNVVVLPANLPSPPPGPPPTPAPYFVPRPSGAPK
jgi:hypothetical protein